MHPLKAAIHKNMVQRGVSRAQRVHFLKEIRFPREPRLLGDSIKVAKGEKKGILTAVLYLAPASRSVPFGGRNMCPNATPGCIAACLGHSSGRLAMSTSQNAQVWKTLAYVHARDWFFSRLRHEIRLHVAKAKRKGMTPALRLDGTSDIGLAQRLAPEFPRVQFYDYTKSATRAVRNMLPGRKVDNWHITYSLAETSENQRGAELVAEAGGNVAAVFRTRKVSEFPARFLGLPVIDGDETDVRFLDGNGVCVGLTVKGNVAHKDRTGFVQEV